MSYGMDGWCKEIYTQPYKGKLTDYIKREDAIKALCKSKCYPGVLCPDEYCLEVRRVFDDIPAAQPERMRGRWIHDRLCTTNGGTYGVRRCSLCEAYYHDIDCGWNFCPYCGADMRGEG